MKMTVEEALKHIGTYAIMVGEHMPLQVAQALDVLKNKARAKPTELCSLLRCGRDSNPRPPA